MIDTTKETKLKAKIVKILVDQGFLINPHLRPVSSEKHAFKAVQQKSRLEQISYHTKFIKSFRNKAQTYCRDACDINPNKIDLELRELKSDTFDDRLFRWWNLVWWTIPYQRPFGRQMRFLLWDKTHDSPFGMVGLQSPILKMSVRDKALEIPNAELDIWVNRSMSAQRIGALPPYNQLIGGKMVALSLTSNEMSKAYKRKYANRVTLIKGRSIDNELLFVTTTSAFGKSSIYNRLKYKKENIAESLGFTQGSGSFHVPQELYAEILDYLFSTGTDISRGYGHGPSRKLKLLSIAFRRLGLREFHFHNIKREFFLIPLVHNLKGVIKNNERPEHVDHPFSCLVDYWKDRWALPRAKRIPEWRNFKVETFFGNLDAMLHEANSIKPPKDNNDTGN